MLQIKEGALPMPSISMTEIFLGKKKPLYDFITVKSTFCAAHRLRGMGKCSRIHGHTYKVKAHIRRMRETNDSDDYKDLVLDFATARGTLQAVLDQDWDHRLLLCEDDALLKVLLEGDGAVALPFEPTAENISRALLDRLYIAFQRVDLALVCFAVDVAESPTTSAVVTI